MEELISFLILLLIAATGLIGLFNKQNKEQGDGKPASQQHPPPAASSQQNRQEGTPPASSRSVGKAVTDKEEISAFKQTESNIAEDEIEQGGDRLDKGGHLSRRKRPVHFSAGSRSVSSGRAIRNGLTGKGMVNSIILAEVLGPPKAARGRQQSRNSVHEQ